MGTGATPDNFHVATTRNITSPPRLYSRQNSSSPLVIPRIPRALYKDAPQHSSLSIIRGIQRRATVQMRRYITPSTIAFPRQLTSGPLPCLLVRRGGLRLAAYTRRLTISSDKRPADLGHLVPNGWICLGGCRGPALQCTTIVKCAPAAPTTA